MNGSAPRVWITRTQPGADTTAERVRALGWDPVVVPLLSVRPIPHAMSSAPSPDAVACVALTSPNTLDRIKDKLLAYGHLPIFAVGDATADAARTIGLPNVISAKGDINALAALIAREVPRGTVFAPGAREPAGDLPALLPKHKVIRLAVYEAYFTDARTPDDIAAVMVHSPRASRILVSNLGAQTSRNLTAIAISDAAATPLNALNFKKIHIAATPDEDGMLSALGNAPTPV